MSSSNSLGDLGAPRDQHERSIDKTAAAGLVFRVDVDATLLDNERIQSDPRNHLEREFGAPAKGSAERIGNLADYDLATLLGQR